MVLETPWGPTLLGDTEQLPARGPGGASKRISVGKTAPAHPDLRRVVSYGLPFGHGLTQYVLSTAGSPAPRGSCRFIARLARAAAGAGAAAGHLARWHCSAASACTAQTAVAWTRHALDRGCMHAGGEEAEVTCVPDSSASYMAASACFSRS
jgi:hypothetical protein